MDEEVNTKPIGLGREKISLLEKKTKQGPEGEIDEEEIGALQKELAFCKVQLKAKESAYMQSLLKLQHYDERTEELSRQLMKSELECDFCMGELREAQARIGDLESKLKETDSNLSEATEANKWLLDELTATGDKWQSMEAALVQERETKTNAVNRAEEIENLANVEKENTELLLKRVEELQELIRVLKVDASEAETKKVQILSEKDAKLEQASSAMLKMQEELNQMGRRLDFMQELETQVFAKSATIVSLQSDLKESNLTISSLKDDVAQATKDVEELRGVLEVKEQEISDRAVYVNKLEVEQNQLKAQTAKLNEKGIQTIHEMHKVRKGYQSAQIGLLEFKDRATRAQVEIAMLKAELHKTRLRLAAAEAAEVKDEGIRSGLYLADQQLTMEVQEVKNENHRLKQVVGIDEASPQEEKPTSHGECSEHALDEAREQENLENEEETLENKEEARITISLEEYVALTANVKAADDIPARPSETANGYEVQTLKRDLEIAQAKVGEFRTRFVQAITRAEAAERAQALAEDQLRSWQERKQLREESVALREESVLRASPTHLNEEWTCAISSPPTPLGEVLNMRL